ncbi:response regulator [Desertifilum sp. FACHB-1129]|uniref:Response regulator n=1 Tax=Desertifilum tharense IPPAS B-1220 TaxID=1781255 RepID=A0ACD5H0D6_9CYAN|nr:MULTISPECIES: response regulator [Desertifilum]MBD2311717.1 response regulator [Desertifilum sp. FACHB-1129]MBD2322758.1 response regulator [Desertifilum sp. FACHB-866]MBD2332848.1 response regulator [Desertifilum sp. FACHB-868]MDA0212406.1 response regulator [Cyanobacteria bacterium FC1]
MSVDARKTIFLVEDNRGDIRLIQEALKSTTTEYEVIVARDGMEAMAYLRKDGEYAEAIRPDLILLDLNLPKKDGREVLAEIKSDPSLKHIPVVVLTTSRNEEDISKSYDLHVNCYISKSRNLTQLFRIVRGIEEFWLETAVLPPKSP